MKHPLQVKQWYDYFKPNSVLDLGCGRGPYLYFWNWFVNNCKGIELSQWAVDNAFTSNIQQGDITKGIAINNPFNLITCIDILEHLDDNELKFVLKMLPKIGDNFIFSIPFIGDPNLTNDKTHKQFRTREAWINLIEANGIKIKETPNDWLYKEQILVGFKK
jgi:2-polyprenyl-3-methyl-5-hydroxy-6-metoxy-1,4-benzoquinol methylase